MRDLTYTVSRIESSVDTLKSLMEYQKSAQRDELYAFEIANLELLIEDMYKYIANQREYKTITS